MGAGRVAALRADVQRSDARSDPCSNCSRTATKASRPTSTAATTRTRKAHRTKVNGQLPNAWRSRRRGARASSKTTRRCKPSRLVSPTWLRKPRKRKPTASCFQPDWFPLGDFRATVDYYHIEITDIIASFSAQFYIDALLGAVAGRSCRLRSDPFATRSPRRSRRSRLAVVTKVRSRRTVSTSNSNGRFRSVRASRRSTNSIRWLDSLDLQRHANSVGTSGRSIGSSTAGLQVGSVGDLQCR